jgi:hypothetical protein
MGQLSDLQADELTKLNRRIDVEYCFTLAVANMNVNRMMLVAIKKNR